MLLAKNFHSKKINVDEFINELLNKRELDKLLYIVPTNRKVRSLRKELITNSPDKLLSKFYVETLYTSAQKIFKPEGEKFLINEPTAIVLLRQCFREIELQYFKNYNQSIPHGTLLKLHYVFSEYKRNGISSKTLIKEIENLEGIEKQKGRDIAALFELYNSKLKTSHLFEIGDVYSELLALKANSFRENFCRAFGNVCYVLIEGFTELSLPEILLINRISSLKDLCCFVKFDFEKNNQTLFSSVIEMTEKLNENGFREIGEKETNPNNFEQELKKNLFSFSKKVKIANDKIKILHAPSREKEVTFIAAEIKTLLLEHAVEPHRICVATNLIANYSNIFRDRFSIYGLPFNLTDRYSLSTFQSVLYFINLLEVAENNFYFKSINRFLSASSEEKEKSLFLDFQIVAAKAKVTAGYKNWIDALNYLLATQNSGNENEDRCVIDSAERIINFLSTTNKKLQPFKKQLTPSEFLIQFEKLISDSNAIGTILQKQNEVVEVHVKAMISFIDTVREVISLLELEYSNSKTFNLGFYLGTIKTAINSARFNIKERSNYGVLITSIEEIRGLNFDYLFLCGLCDGDFPTRYAPEIFVQEKFVRGETKHLNEEQLLFYQALKTANKNIYLSFPAGESNKEFSESIFVKEIKAHFEFEELNHQKHNNILYSEDELLSFLGKHHRKLVDEKIQNEKIKTLLGAILESVKKDEERNSTDDIKSEFKGYIFYENETERLTAFENLIYSVTQLESYAKCPFKYFMERVVRATAIEEPSDEIQPLELGLLLHQILFDFYSSLLKDGKKIQNCTNRDFKYFSDLIFAMAEEKLKQFKFNSTISFFEVEKIIGIDGKRENSILYKFLENERTNGDFTPQFLEVAFGFARNKTTDSHLSDFEISGIKLRGQIDRIDIDEKEKSFKVLDYKAGNKVPTKDDLLEGLSLQIPVYITAARKLIQKHFGEDLPAAIPAIYSLKYEEAAFGQNLVIHLNKNKIKNADPTALDEIISELEKIAAEKIVQFAEGIKNGEFPLSRLPNRASKVCDYCNFVSVCRVKENEQGE